MKYEIKTIIAVKEKHSRMIDFQKELAKFDFLNVDDEFVGYYNETIPLLEVFNSTLKRISKELNSANIQLEEVLAQYTEENAAQKEKDSYITELKRTVYACEEENLSLVKTLVAVLDRLEDIYRYALKNEHGSWAEQMRLIWRNTAEHLLSQGMIRIEGKDTLFDPRLHSAVQVTENNAVSNGMILEVLRCGYMYRSHLLRKAQVIVNKTDRSCGSNGQHCGN